MRGWTTMPLVAQDGSNPNYLIAVLGNLANTHGENAFGGTAEPPRLSDPNVELYKSLDTIIGPEVKGGQYNGQALPKRAVLWPISDNAPVETKERPLPAAAQWIKQTGAPIQGIYVAKGNEKIGPYYALWTSDQSPQGAAYVSGVTGTNAPLSTRRYYPTWSRVIGYGGGVLFFLAAFNLLWTASSITQSYNLLTHQQGGFSEDFAKQKVAALSASCANTQDAKESACLTKDATLKIVTPCADPPNDHCISVQDNTVAGTSVAERQSSRDDRDKKLQDYYLKLAPFCVGNLTTWAGNIKEARKQGNSVDIENPDALRCQTLLGEAISYASANLVVKQEGENGFVLALTSGLQHLTRGLLGWLVPTSGAQTVSLGTPTTLMMLGVIAVLVGLGLGVNGTPFGALTSPNGRYSLSLAQVTFWTVLVLTSVMAISIFNGGLVSEMIRHYPTLPKGATTPVAVVNGFFPSIPDQIWAVLGITFGSTMLSVLIKSIKGTADDISAADVAAGNTKQTGGVGFFNAPIARADPSHKASVADWFLGEDEGNKDRIDISRVQMVLITAGLLVTYGNALFAEVRDLSLPEILLAIKHTDVLIAAIPPVGATMAVMLAISHATYLVAKAADSSSSQDPKK
ncbi:hypothetical protein ACQR1Q_33410 [Bradyrhizobium oligotrophicum]